VTNDSLYSQKRLQHLQATSLMSDFDDANCVSPFGFHLNSNGVIHQQNYRGITLKFTATIQKQKFNVCRTVAEVGQLQNDLLAKYIK
jgi:hypothetical protein